MRCVWALTTVLFEQRRLNKVEQAALDDKSASSDLDALNSPGPYQLVGAGSAKVKHVGGLFDRQQQLGSHLQHVSFIGEGGNSTLLLGSVSGRVTVAMADVGHSGLVPSIPRAFSIQRASRASRRAKHFAPCST